MLQVLHEAEDGSKKRNFAAAFTLQSGSSVVRERLEEGHGNYSRRERLSRIQRHRNVEQWTSSTLPRYWLVIRISNTKIQLNLEITLFANCLGLTAMTPQRDLIP